MERKLQRINGEQIYHFVNEQRVEGAHKNIRGDVSNIRGDVDMCGLTDEDRSRGVDIADLVE